MLLRLCCSGWCGDRRPRARPPPAVGEEAARCAWAPPRSGTWWRSRPTVNEAQLAQRCLTWRPAYADWLTAGRGRVTRLFGCWAERPADARARGGAALEEIGAGRRGAGVMERSSARRLRSLGAATGRQAPAARQQGGAGDAGPLLIAEVKRAGTLLRSTASTMPSSVHARV